VSKQCISMLNVLQAGVSRAEARQYAIIALQDLVYTNCSVCANSLREIS
jgi:hypothetical protein